MKTSKSLKHGALCMHYLNAIQYKLGVIKPLLDCYYISPVMVILAGVSCSFWK